MLLLTGGSGFLGKELLKELLRDDYAGNSSQQILVLLRAKDVKEAEERLLQIISELKLTAKEASRLRPVLGDITLPHLGLDTDAWNLLISEVSTVIHSAASTSLGQSLSSARQINVGGTEQVLNLGYQRKKLNLPFHLHHISTAYVAGDTTHTVKPDHLKLRGCFKNAYEQSKAEAESLTRQAADYFPVSIYRPSVIVGNSLTGETGAFNVIYLPARFLVQGLFRAVPAIPDTPFDLVPVDFVARSFIALKNHIESDSYGPQLRSFHLASGYGRESCPSEIVEWIVNTFNKYRQAKRELGHPPLLAPDLVALLQFSWSMYKNFAIQSVHLLEKIFAGRTELLSQLCPFIPYMIRNPRFDTSHTASVLGSSHLPAPLFTTYAERLFRYCVETNWGRREVVGRCGL